jgi:hypothetical protein
MPGLRELNKLMRLLVGILVFAFLAPAWAEDEPEACENDSWEVHGKLEGEVARFDKMVQGLAKSRDPIRDINDHLKKYGLPQELGAGDGFGEDHRDRLVSKAEGPGGNIVALFLKKMTVAAASSLHFDQIHEVESAEKPKVLKTWNIPFEAAPEAVDGDEIIFSDTVSAICKDDQKAVNVAVKPGGDYRILDAKKLPGFTMIPDSKCKAKTVIKGSDYAVCGESVDSKTKKKRIFVWQMPMT